jgi:hypothetical protein
MTKNESLFSTFSTLRITTDDSCNRYLQEARHSKMTAVNYSFRQNPINRMQCFKYRSSNMSLRFENVFLNKLSFNFCLSER